MIQPTPEQIAAALLKRAFEDYRDYLARYGRIPASRETVLHEAADVGVEPIWWLHMKMARLEP